MLPHNESTTCVTIWGNIAINKNTDLLEAMNRRSILLATHLPIKSYSNKFGLNTTAYSSIILNPQEFEEAKFFFGWHSSVKERDMDLFAISATPIKSKPTIDIQILTISDLLEKSQVSPFKPSTFGIIAQIVSFNLSKEPWYESCSKCKKIFIQASDGSRCSSCGSTSTVAEIRLEYKSTLKILQKEFLLLCSVMTQ